MNTRSLDEILCRILDEILCWILALSASASLESLLRENSQALTSSAQSCAATRRLVQEAGSRSQVRLEGGDRTPTRPAESRWRPDHGTTEVRGHSNRVEGGHFAGLGGGSDGAGTKHAILEFVGGRSAKLGGGHIEAVLVGGGRSEAVVVEGGLKLAGGHSVKLVEAELVLGGA